MKIKFLIVCLAALALSAFAREDDGEEVLELDDGIDIEVVEDDGAIDRMPELTVFVDAPYPEELAEEGIAGGVLLEMIVGEDGAVDSVWVVRPLHPALDTLALAASRQFKFSPAEAGGEAVAVMLQYEYEFIPPKGEAAGADDAGTDTGITDTGVAAGQHIHDGDDDAFDIHDSFELTVYGREEVMEVARHRITISEVRRLPGMGNDAARAVQAMPGVSRPRFGGNEVVVRGSPGWASRYFIDGLSVPLLYHVAGSNSIYPSDALDGVDFYPGGFSSRYGGAVGGVIEMRPRRPKTDRIQGYADLSMLDGSLFVEGPVSERVSFMVSGRKGFTGDLLNLYFKYGDAGSLPLTLAPFYWDYLARTDVVLNENHRLTFSLIGSRDSVGVFVPDTYFGSSEVGGALDEMNMMVTFHSLVAGLDSRLSERWSNVLRLSGTWAAQRMSLFGYATSESTNYMAHLRNQVSYRHSGALTVNIGADAEIQNAAMRMTMIAGQNMIVRDTINDYFGILGGYASVEWKPAEGLLLIPSARFDNYPELMAENANVPAFRVNGRYELTGGHTVKAAAGTYSKTPEPMGMVTHDLWGEADLPSTKAAQYVAGYEWQITDLLNLDAQTYYNQMWDVARGYNGELDHDPSREIQRRWFSDGRDRTYGLELMLRHNRSDKFFGWASYTLSRSETWSKREGKWILSSRDEPHHLQILGSWKLPKERDVGMRARFVSGKPTSPIVGTVENENGKYISPIYGERNSTRHDPFFQVDVRFDKKIERGKYNWTYYVDLQNVLWPLYRSPEFILWNYNYTESQKLGMIPMASAGVRVEF
ncbi:MAG: TonB-dependent receptor [Chitinispirillia bacterium]|nr:TonB-dependent receptor [Chitinispirillia bacterium]